MSHLTIPLAAVVTGGKRYNKAEVQLDDERGVGTVAERGTGKVLANLVGPVTFDLKDTWTFANGTVTRLEGCRCGSTEVSDA